MSPKDGHNARLFPYAHQKEDLMPTSSTTHELIRVLTEVTKRIYPLVPALRQFIFVIHGNNSYQLRELAADSTERLVSTFNKGDEHKKVKDFASVAALISPQDYGRRFLYEIRENKTFRFYLLDNEHAVLKEPEAYPLDFSETGDGATPECELYVATTRDDQQAFAAYIMKERLKEKREILAVPLSFAEDAGKAESYVAKEISSGEDLKVFRYSMRDTYKSEKQIALLDKAMRMLEKAGFCESSRKK